MATGRVENTGAVWNARRTMLDVWGTAPTRVEVIKGWLTLKQLDGAAGVLVTPLDGSAKPLGETAGGDWKLAGKSLLEINLRPAISFASCARWPLDDKRNRRSHHSATLYRKTFPRRVRGTAGPSAPLRSGRDDKGKGNGCIESGCRTEAFLILDPDDADLFWKNVLKHSSHIVVPSHRLEVASDRSVTHRLEERRPYLCLPLPFSITTMFQRVTQEL